MSNPLDIPSSPSSEFQVHFGGPPGSSDAAVECKKWERLCAELLADRARLREELAKAQADRDAYMKTVYYFMGKDRVCPYSKEELLSCVDQEPPLRDLIAELEREMSNGT